MSSPKETAPARKNASFMNSDNPVLEVVKMKGERWCWPIAALSEWFYRPSLMLSVDGERPRQVEELVMSIGLRRVTIRGLRLDKVLSVLQFGSGGTLVEQGAHFTELAEPGETFVEEIIIAQGDDSLPGAGV